MARDPRSPPADRPRIAVILDENTSTGSTRYEAAKGYFHAVAEAGGLPFGLPYLPEIVGPALDGFDGFLAVGGRFAYPDAWYRPGERSRAPASDRYPVERALMEGYLALDKPVLGLCAGMQMLACLHGCRLTDDVQARLPHALAHDERDARHLVRPVAGSLLARIVGDAPFQVNTHHREAVAEVVAPVAASAYAPDGVVEAVEVAGRRFALGLQWHQELITEADHPGAKVFQAFVAAARSGGQG